MYFFQGWLHFRKPGTETWKKRWVVLQGAEFTCYANSNCTTVKEQLNLSPHMHIEVRYMIITSGSTFSASMLVITGLPDCMKTTFKLLINR